MEKGVMLYIAYHVILPPPLLGPVDGTLSRQSSSPLARCLMDTKVVHLADLTLSPCPFTPNGFHLPLQLPTLLVLRCNKCRIIEPCHFFGPSTSQEIHCFFATQQSQHRENAVAPF